MLQQKTKFESLQSFQNSVLHDHRVLEIVFSRERDIDASIFKICPLLASCKNIESLTLDTSLNDIRAQGASRLITALGYCTNLRSLNLNFSSGKIEDGPRLGRAIAHFTNLTSLNINLTANYIKDEGIRDFCSELSVCKDLTSLKLSFQNNYFDEMSQLSFVEMIKVLPNLQHLSLSIADNSSANNLSSTFGDELGKCEQLKSLSLIFGINGHGIVFPRIFESLQKYSHLRPLSLELIGNICQNTELRNLSETLNSVTKLTHLNITFWRFRDGGENFSGLLEQLRNCSHLTSLRISMTFGVILKNSDKYTLRKIMRLVNLKIN